MNWEIRFDINTLPCVKQRASGNRLYSTGSSAQCSVMTQMGEGGRGRSKREGIQVYIQLIHFIVQQKLTQHCKAILPQLKKKEYSQSLTAQGSDKTFRFSFKASIERPLTESLPCTLANHWNQTVTRCFQSHCVLFIIVFINTQPIYGRYLLRKEQGPLH